MACISCAQELRVINFFGARFEFSSFEKRALHLRSQPHIHCFVYCSKDKVQLWILCGNLGTGLVACERPGCKTRQTPFPLAMRPAGGGARPRRTPRPQANHRACASYRRAPAGPPNRPPSRGYRWHAGSGARLRMTPTAQSELIERELQQTGSGHRGVGRGGRGGKKEERGERGTQERLQCIRSRPAEPPVANVPQGRMSYDTCDNMEPIKKSRTDGREEKRKREGPCPKQLKVEAKKRGEEQRKTQR